MTDITINIEDLGTAVAGFITIIVTIYGYLKSKGYIDIWKSKLTIKSDVAQAVSDNQNGNALAKLRISDEILTILQVHASDETGMIDPEKLKKVLDNYKRINELVSLNRCMTLKEQNEVCGIVFQILGDYHHTEKTGSDV
jgi:hypothetical protein